MGKVPFPCNLKEEDNHSKYLEDLLIAHKVVLLLYFGDQRPLDGPRKKEDKVLVHNLLVHLCISLQAEVEVVRDHNHNQLKVQHVSPPKPAGEGDPLFVGHHHHHQEFP